MIFVSLSAAAVLVLLVAVARGLSLAEVTSHLRANPVTVTIDTTTVTHQVNPLFLGCHSDSGYVHQATGFYAQMVYGESFEGNLPEHSVWTPVTTAQGTVSIDGSMQFHGHNSLRVVFQSGSGVVGSANRGLGNEGFFLQANQPYEGYFFVTSGSAVTLSVSLRDFANNDRVLASTTINFPGGDWTMVNFTLTPSSGTQCVDGSRDSRVSCGRMAQEPGHMCVQCGGEIVVGLAAPGTVNIDYVYLQPGAWGRYKGLPVKLSGVQTLLQMGIQAIRQGGSFSIGDYYAWYNWIGAPWTRPSVGAVWGNELIGGWGPFEMIDMCNAAGIEPVITLSANSGRCCSGDDMANLVEYCYGDASTTWGSRRIANGHPDPYKVRYFELGNEQYNHNYADQVTAMEAKAKQVGVGNTLYYMFPNNDNWLDTADADRVEALGLKDHVVLDEHVGAGGAIENSLRQFQNHRNLTFGTVNAETNAGTHHMQRAVQEAADLNDWFNCAQADCSRIHFRTASFCTERSGHYDNFDQGISFFLPNMSWLQPPGYVHQMINQTFFSNGVSARVSDGSAVSASAQLSDDKSTLVIRITNNDRGSTNVQLNISPSGGWENHATVWTLSSNNPNDANPPSDPTHISPQKSAQALSNFNINVPAYSYTVVLLQHA